MNKCLQCKKETKNPKFCSQSCAAKWNNHYVTRKRMQPTNHCKKCNALIKSNIWYCIDCRTTDRVTKCLNCGIELSYPHKKYCSIECRNIAKNQRRKITKHYYPKTRLAQRKDRHNRKQKIIDIKGSKCEICGYNKNITALCFHHIDPSTKLFNLSVRSIYGLPWELVLKEIAKCQLLCLNCHAEQHDLINSLNCQIS